jgi:hypothetical protein
MTVLIAKRKVVEVLRSRGEEQRADWVERDLPDEFHTDQHSGLLQLLRIDLSDLADVSSSDKAADG